MIYLYSELCHDIDLCLEEGTSNIYDDEIDKALNHIKNAQLLFEVIMKISYVFDSKHSLCSRSTDR